MKNLCASFLLATIATVGRARDPEPRHSMGMRGCGGVGHSRGTWGVEGSPADVPDGVDHSPGGVLVLIQHHMALGIHPHALPWEMAAALAPALAETRPQRCPGGAVLATAAAAVLPAVGTRWDHYPMAGSGDPQDP